MRWNQLGRCLIAMALLLGIAFRVKTTEVRADEPVSALTAKTENDTNAPYIDVASLPPVDGDALLLSFVPRPGRFILKVKRGWSGKLPFTGNFDGGDWEILESHGVGSSDRMARDQAAVSELFPSQNPCLDVVSFGSVSRIVAVCRGTATIRYIGERGQAVVQCELRVEVEPDTSEIDSAIKEAIPQAEVKIIEVRSAAILTGTVPADEDIELATRIGEQFYAEIISQLKVAQTAMESPEPLPATKNTSQPPDNGPGLTSLQPVKQESPKRRSAGRAVSPSEVRKLHDDVRELRNEVRALSELLKERRESKDREVKDLDSKRDASVDEPAIKNELLYFTAKWCAPCQEMAPIIQKLQLEGYAIRFVDVDAEPRVCRRFNVETIPNLLFVVDGKEFDRITGINTADNLRKMLKRRLAGNLHVPELTLRTYAVADIVVPIPSESGQNPQPLIADWFRLIETITNEVNPGSWIANGGPCSINVNQQTFSLVVRAPVEIHERVKKILERERVKSDVQIVIEGKVIKTPDILLSELTDINVAFDPVTKSALLEAAKVASFIKTIELHGGSVESNPKLTSLNGQTFRFEMSPWRKRNGSSAKLALYLRGVTASDRDSIGFSLAMTNENLIDELTRRTTNVPNRGYVLFDLTNDLEVKSPLEEISGRTYLLVQPRILIQGDVKSLQDN